ncbi:Nn.00g001330.m01.CDS01 [Neocucurbitaria sp. VM-36]
MASLNINRLHLLALFFITKNVFASDQHPLYENLPSLPNLDPIYQIPDAQAPPSKHGNWLGFGGNLYNNHWASSDAVIDINNVDTLQPFCQKAYDPGVSAAPLLEGGIAYYPTWNGLLVALDYRKCETRWELNVTELILKEKGDSSVIVATGAALAARTTPVSDGEVLFIGTLARAILVAVDKKTGRVIDTLSFGRHPLSILTQSPTLYKGRLFIGVSTTESGPPSLDPSYKLSHHGSMNAVELRYGRLALLWTTHMVPPGANFSGASIWGSQPSIDPIRQQVFIGTGQLFSLPPEIVECQDANKNLVANAEHLVNEPCLPRNVYQTSVLALDIATGKINWYKTLGPLDAWNAACVPGLFPGSDTTEPGPHCPKNVGNDTDFGMAPAFVLGSEATPDGKDIVVAGQKSGNLYAFSAQTGTVLWSQAVAPGGLEGGLSWGVAVDDSAVYYTAINSNRVESTLPNGDSISNSAFGAVNLKDGNLLWQTAAPRNTSTVIAPLVVNDIVLTGVSGNWSDGSLFPIGPGSFLALNKRTGEILLEVPLDAYFRGNIATVHEYVMFGTGYGGFEAPAKGTFNVWKLKTAGEGGTPVPDPEQEAKKRELERQRAEVKKKIKELERQEDELDRLRDEL